MVANRKKAKKGTHNKKTFNINEFMNGNEFYPRSNAKNWEKINDTAFSTYNNMEKVEYTITKKDIELVIKNKKNIETDLKNLEKKSYTIVRMYMASMGGRRIVRYTTSTLLCAIRNRIFNYLKGNSVDLIDTFGKLEGVHFNLLEFLLLNKNNKLNKKFLKERKLKYLDKNVTLIDKIHDIINKISKNEKIPMRCANIYKITEIETSRHLFFYDSSKKRLTLNLIKTLIKKGICNDIPVENIDNYKIELVEAFKYRFEIEVKIRTDYHIIVLNSIKNGLNNGYHKFDALVGKDDKLKHQLIHTCIQDEVAHIIYISPIIDKCTTGYIFKLQNNKKCYIGIVNNNKKLDKIIFEKYNVAIEELENGNNVSKLTELLSTARFQDLKIDILETRTKKNNIDLIDNANKIIREWDAIDNGYNDSLIKKKERRETRTYKNLKLHAKI